MGSFFQTAANGIVNGSLLALLTLGFGLIVGTTGRFHWAMSTTLMVAALVTALLATNVGVSFLLAAAIGIAASMLLGVAIEVFAYRPLVAGAKGPPFLAVFLTSLAITIIGENVVRMTVGSAGLFMVGGFEGLQRQRLTVGSVNVSALDATFVVVVWVLAITLWAVLKYSRWGRSIRAVQVNPVLARVVAINPDGIYVIVFAIGSFLAGVSGVMTGIRISVMPDMGVQPMFIAFVAAFVAGTQSGVLRFALTGLLIGMVQSISTNWISVQWAPFVVFGILFVYVALRPAWESASCQAFRQKIPLGRGYRRAEA